MVSMQSINLTDHFLIAMPAMDDPFFSKSLIYIAEHNTQGALGVIVNRPLDMNLAALLEKTDLPTEAANLAKIPVFFGGPVQTERGFVLHEPMVIEGAPENESAYASTMTIPGGLEMTTSKDVLEALSDGAGPKRVLVTLGYSSWD